MSHPLLVDRKQFLAYIAVWVIIGFIQFASLAWFTGLDSRMVLLDSLLSSFVYALFSFSFWYTCKYVSLEKNGLVNILLQHALSALIATLLWLYLVTFLVKTLDIPPGTYSKFLDDTWIIRMWAGLLMYLVSISGYYLHIYYEGYRKEQVQAAELITLVREAELNNLKLQINPHFIFNSLNSVNALIMTDPPAASAMTVKLAEYMRESIYRVDKGSKKMKEELKISRLYLDIERTRFGERIIYSEDIDERCMEAMVPGMMLQPLFENAVKHGLAQLLGDVRISLSGRIQGKTMILRLQNDTGVENLSASGEGVGLENVRSRLALIYGGAAGLSARRDADTFIAEIRLPLEYIEPGSRETDER